MALLYGAGASFDSAARRRGKSEMEEDELFSDEVEFKAGDMTVAEFKKIIRQAIQQAMREALSQAEAMRAARKVAKK